MTLPKTTWSTWSGAMPARSMAALDAMAPRSDGATPASDFPYDPMAVRAAEEMTTLVKVAFPSKSGCPGGKPRRWYVRAHEHHRHRATAELHRRRVHLRPRGRPPRGSHPRQGRGDRPGAGVNAGRRRPRRQG